MRITRQHVLPEATVFVAHEGRQLVGTVTMTTDSPAGLPLDLISARSSHDRDRTALHG